MRYTAGTRPLENIGTGSASSLSRHAAQRRLIDELLSLFGGRTQPVLAHLIESGKLTVEEVKEGEKALRSLTRKEKSA